MGLSKDSSGGSRVPTLSTLAGWLSLAGEAGRQRAEAGFSDVACQNKSQIGGIPSIIYYQKLYIFLSYIRLSATRPTLRGRHFIPKQRRVTDRVPERECAEMSSNQAKPLPHLSQLPQGSQEFLVCPGPLAAITGGLSPPAPISPFPSRWPCSVAFFWPRAASHAL